MTEKKRLNVITMGCSKNLVDSERLARIMADAGYDVCFDADGFSGGDVVVNTCGFIGDAKEESIEMILECVKAKADGVIGSVYVMGCLSERYRRELPESLPEVDGWYGKFDWTAIASDLAGKEHSPKSKTYERILSDLPHRAYLKIAEGCNRFCAFCAIPIITGRHTSRPIEEILEEVRSLVDEGVKEFNVIAQDLSSYGTDLYGRHALAELIERMALTPGVEWIRLHYAYPADFPTDILPVMAKYDNVCKYLDIALQHIANPVLDNMRRHIDKDATLRLIETIRREVPGIKLRTTLMTGFPGEGEKEFEELVDFVRTQRFDRMGAFAYCEEDDTYAAKNLDDSIPDDVKQSRLDKIMEIQEEIALQLNEEMIGTVQRVLIDRIEGDKAIGRTQFDSPEVDPEVIINDSSLSPGQFVNVRITEAFPFELVGETVR